MGKERHTGPEEPAADLPVRKCCKGQAVLRLWTRSRNVVRTDLKHAIAGRMASPASASRRSTWIFPSVRSTAPFMTPSREPSQPHKVGDTSSCLRHRRRLFHSGLPGSRPKRMPISLADSCKTQCRYKASIITSAAYQRQGWSQSGSRLIVCPQLRQRNRRTQMTIQPFSGRPQTCRLYIPCPTICNTPSALRAGCPQQTQNRGRSFSKDGDSESRAHSCSTHLARLCRMTTAVWAAVVDAQSHQESCRPLSASFPTAAHPNQLFWKSQSVCRLMRHNQAGSCKPNCGIPHGVGSRGTLSSPCINSPRNSLHGGFRCGRFPTVCHDLLPIGIFA